MQRDGASFPSNRLLGENRPGTMYRKLLATRVGFHFWTPNNLIPDFFNETTALPHCTYVPLKALAPFDFPQIKLLDWALKKDKYGGNLLFPGHKTQPPPSQHINHWALFRDYGPSIKRCNFHWYQGFINLHQGWIWFYSSCEKYSPDPLRMHIYHQKIKSPKDCQSFMNKQELCFATSLNKHPGYL